LELAQEQISKALDTAKLLHDSMEMVAEGKVSEARTPINKLFKVEEEIDSLRLDVFKELSKGAAMFADYREDILHLVKRLDTFADHVKDAARCIVMLGAYPIPKELWDKVLFMTATIVECAKALRVSIENISPNPAEAVKGANKVEEIEGRIDNEYLETKSLFIKYADHVNSGAMIILDDLIEFLEEAADMCADTADYIVTLASSE
jgi:predicted phosphate transport protein (TIGR00153 family)